MSRLNGKEIAYWKPILEYEDGNFCQKCQKTPLSIKPEYFVKRLIIHEKVYERPIQRQNLCLLCDSCNQTIHPDKFEGKYFKREMTPEMSINRQKEGPARRYLIERVIKDNGVRYNTLVAACAEKIGCSIKTITDNYLDKLLSDEGPLINQLDNVYLRGCQPNMKFDILSETWIEEKKNEDSTPQIVDQIKQKYLSS